MLKLKHKLEVNMDFNNLSVESYAAFILGIVFTVISIAGAIVLLKRLAISSTVLKVFNGIVFPFIAIFCWLYMIIDIYATFDIGTNFYSSFLITLGFFLIVFAVYAIVYTIKKNKKERELAYLANLENEVNELQDAVDEIEENKANEEENVVIVETKTTTKKKTTKK